MTNSKLCGHATETDKPLVIACDLGRFGGTPHVAVCRHCTDYNGPIRGAGDVIATITHAVGITPCGGCQKRREKLNDWIPLGDRHG